MFEASSRAVLASCLLVASLGMAQGQQAADGPQTAPDASGCSGFMCIFHRGGSAQPARAPAPVQAQDVAPAAPVADAEVGARKVVRARKAERPITIAAAPAELVRLKTMAATLHHTKVKFLDPGSARSADLVVLAPVDPAPSTRAIKLFTEELHVVAGSDVHALSDLNGKSVSFGPEGAPTQAAARKAFATLGVVVHETPLDFDNALDGLATGDIAAVVMLAPEPSGRLKSLRAPGLHLVSWPEGAQAPSGAVVSSIDASAYPDLGGSGEAVRALGVDAVLRTEGNAMRQPNVRRFLASLTQHSAELSQRGFDLLRADLLDHANRQVADTERR